jgi:hypothetical protein
MTKETFNYSDRMIGIIFFVQSLVLYVLSVEERGGAD